MRKSLYRALTPTLIVIFSILASGLVASLTTLRTSKDVVERYVSVWEEEVARNLLLKGDPGLFEKIRLQISDVASDVDATGDDAKIKQAKGECFAEQTVNVTLYGTPAGELYVCRSPRKLLLRSLASPIFAFGISAGLLLAAWLVRRAGRDAADRALNELAVRVAHDIRAPLMALKMAAEQSDADESSSLIEKATARISAIADDLLEQNRPTQSKRTTKSSSLLGPSIQQLISEKKLLTPPDVVFEFRAPRTPEGAEPARSSPELDRAISNLLQNAIEATLADHRTEKTRRISIDAVESVKEISVTIRDNGVGIPPEVLSRVGETGFSYGKTGGNGIGFSSARSWARSLFGDLEIRSLAGTGTEVRLTIPR